MGECDPPFNLEEWVPNSFDLIAVGVEECMSMIICILLYELPIYPLLSQIYCRLCILMCFNKFFPLF